VAGRNGESGLTIVQVLSWLNYGGVESYVIRLARALRERGHRLVVVSKGGPLVSELEESGIDHFQLDFTGLRMPRGVLALRRLLEREQADVVNAHNWRAGLVSYLACRRAGVPHVLTIHGTRRPVNHAGVSYWSKKVVVVSEASRRNLVEDFGLPSDRVVRSMIGVDCERFRPAPPDRSLEEELGLRPAAPRVVHVSRFSHSKTPVALALIEAMEALQEETPGIELVLVGEGPESDAVRRAAQRMNRRLGREAVSVPGGRTDIPRVLSLGEVVTGTASVALEAMACGKPVVAAGKGGYFGIVGPDNLGRAEESCFADHEQMEELSVQRLKEDVAALLCDKAKAARLGAFGRQTAESRYHVPKLASDMEGIYRQTLCDREETRQIVVFHLNQIGDLMFTLPALKALREEFPRAHITSVMRPHLAGLAAAGGLVDDIVRRPAGRRRAAIGLGLELRKLQPDLAISFSQSATMTLCARLSGARQRVGYVDSHLARLLTHRIQVRGIPSPEKVMQLVRGLGLKSGQTNYVGLLRLAEEDHRRAEELLEESQLRGDGPLVALAPGESDDRPYKSWDAGGFMEVAHRLVQRESARLVVVGAESDRAIGHKITARLGPRQAANLAGRTTPSQLAAILARCDLLIGIDSGPMHVAAAMGRPVVGLFGPTDPRQTGPLGGGHEVIFHRQPCWGPCIHPVTPSCTDRACMMAITPDEVLAATGRILGREPAQERRTA
jgi:lipopolysaccharide heptosyltransferase II